MLKSIELLPNDKNILDTLYKDPFNRSKDIEAFLKLLTKVQGHYVISIDGEWGSGKTFFVKQCSMVLDVLRDKGRLTSEKKEKVLHLPLLGHENLRKNLKGQYYVYFDAWANDSYDNPIVAILNTLIKHLTVFEKANFKKIYDIFEEIGQNFFNKKFGIDLASLKRILDTKEIDDIKKQEDLHQYIEKIINNLIADGQRLNIFIDELDRCKPSFAVKLLEQVKHYFLLDNVTFIFSTNIAELSKTIDKYYGNGFRGDRYLNRFFDLFLSIPKIDSKSYFKYLISKEPQMVFEKNEISIIRYLNMSLRNINRFVANNQIIDYEKLIRNPEIFTQTDKDIYMDILWAIVPIIIGLRVTNPIQGNLFLAGKEGHFFTKVLSVTIFWDLLKYDDNLEDRMLALCEITTSDGLEKNKEKISRKIYSKLFAVTTDVTQIKTEADHFWYAVSQNLNDITNTISRNLNLD